MSAARRYTAGAISGLEPRLADAVAVMVSELAANAVRHSGTHFTVTIDQSAQLIRVAVTDSGGGTPVVRAPEPIEPSGRGLQIVQALASEWGVVPNAEPPGKTVWFTVGVEPTAEPRGPTAPIRGIDLPSVVNRARADRAPRRRPPAVGERRRTDADPRSSPVTGPQVTHTRAAGCAARRGTGIGCRHVSHTP